MKLKDIIQNIDKSENNTEWVDLSNIALELDISINYDTEDKNDKLKCYWISNWNCTDSWVGLRAYFLDDEFVFVSSQDSRKSDEILYWKSKDSFNKVRDFILSLMKNSDVDNDINICDLDEDFGIGYNIEFNSQLVRDNKPRFNGERVGIIKKIKEQGDWGIGSKLIIELKSGEEKEVDIKDLTFDYYIKEEL